MKHRPIEVELTHLDIDDNGLAERIVMETDFDVSAILAEHIGRDADAIVSFLADPHDHPLILQAVAEHPDVDDVTAEIDGDSDFASAIAEGLRSDDDPERIVDAWMAWMDAWDAHNGADWADIRWAKHDGELASWLADERRPSKDVLKGMARRILADGAFRAALLEAAREPAEGTVETMRTCVAVEAALNPPDRG